MSSRNRPIDVGTERGRTIRFAIGRELRLARNDRNLSLSAVCGAVGVSSSTGSRLERGLLEHVDVMLLAKYSAAVGLDVSIRVYPGGQPIRDAAHASILNQFRSMLHPSLGWAVEVPMPTPGDQRSWDGLVRASNWRYGVEAETSPWDGQALLRRLALKQRDGKVDGVLLILRDSRRSRAFRSAIASSSSQLFSVSGAVALERLRRGEDPGGGAIITLKATGRT